LTTTPITIIVARVVKVFASSSGSVAGGSTSRRNARTTNERGGAGRVEAGILGDHTTARRTSVSASNDGDVLS
jgi:hypothetical protein